MANTIVGTGLVPNVYIKNIILQDSGANSYQTVITLEVNDVMENNSLLWSDDEFFRDFFKIAVIMTYDPQMSEQLKQGLIDPVPEAIKQSRLYNDATQIKSIPIKQFNSQMIDGYKKFHHTCVYNVQSNTPNAIMDVYAVGFLDMHAIEIQRKINLNKKLRLYYGPLTGERIIENGRVTSQTNLYMQPNQAVWRGPVHVHNGVYMGGAFHTIQDHPTLNRIQVQNTKLIDNRTRNYRKSSSDYLVPSPIVGNLLHSFNAQIDLNGIFDLDMRQLALRKTKNGKKIFGVSEALFLELTNSIEIRNLKIVKQMVTTYKTLNRVGTPEIKIKKTNNYSSLDNVERVYLTREPFVRQYQFVDVAPNYDDKAQYKYSLRAVIVDKSQNFLKLKSEEINQAINFFKSQLVGIKVANNYDPVLDGIKPNGSIPDFSNVVSKYYSTLFLF